jgi:TolB-like protein
MYNTIKSICFLLFFSLTLPCFSAEKPRVAILSISSENVPRVDISVFTRLVCDDFVNIGRYTVLEHREIEKVLEEQSMKDFGVVSSVDALRFGQLLDVQYIVTGSLMRYKDRYLVDLRMINVETSSIEISNTLTFSADEDLSTVAKLIVEKTCGTTCSTIHSSGLQGENKDCSDSLAVIKAQTTSLNIYKKEIPETLDCFLRAGLFEDDYTRFSLSGKSVAGWVKSQNVSMPLSVGLSILPVSSGYYCTHNYGIAIFFSLIKTMSCIGMLQIKPKGGESSQWQTTYGTVFVTSTLLDAISGAWFASEYNKNCQKLLKDIVSIGKCR